MKSIRNLPKVLRSLNKYFRGPWLVEIFLKVIKNIQMFYHYSDFFNFLVLQSLFLSSAVFFAPSVSLGLKSITKSYAAKQLAHRSFLSKIDFWTSCGIVSDFSLPFPCKVPWKLWTLELLMGLGEAIWNIYQLFLGSKAQ